MALTFTEVTNFLGITKQKPDVEDSSTETPKVLQKPKEVRKVLYTWEALGRPEMKTISQKKLKTLTVVGIAICVVLVAMQEFFLILGVLSLIFVSYMLNQTPPETIRYEITNKGVKFGELFYHWENMRYFFFTNEGGTEAVAIDMVNTLPARIYLSVKQGDRNKVHSMLEPYVNFMEQAPKTFVDRAYDSVIDKLDLESE